MAKMVVDKSAGKAQAKPVGGLKGAFSRSSSRVSTAAHPTSAPRGTVSVKPQGRLRTFLREVRVELTKVTWPARKELIQATAAVIIAVVVAGVYIGLWDYVWNIVIRFAKLG
jgi:preprotein translocase subunit SecE